MNAYAAGQSEALAAFLTKEAGWQDVKQQLRRAAVIGQLGVAGVGGVGGLQALQHTAPGTSKTQLALNAAGGAVGGIGGAAAGGITGGIEGVGSGFNKGVDVGKGIVQPTARQRMSNAAF